MKSKYLENGIKIIYVHRPGNLTSFSIGLDAGANVEKYYEYGIAHMVEHLVFKGTSNRNEFEINRDCDNIFGFNNAMTNYPYVIYYGTLLSEDFLSGLRVYSDILINPTFPQEGFKEEVQVICQEIKEWKEDFKQCCEDTLFRNAFEKRRIRELILGNEEAISYINIDSIKEFYYKYYCPENCVISVVSSLQEDKVFSIVEECFASWKVKKFNQDILFYESNKKGIFNEKVDGVQGCKIQYCFPIHDLNEKESAALSIFNYAFGEGTSSILYDEVRTKKGIAYEVYSNINKDKGIKLFTIYLGTSNLNIYKSIDVVDKCILKVKDKNYFNSIINEHSLNSFVRIMKLKKELKYEKSIALCNALTTYEIMFGEYKEVFSEIRELYEIIPQEIYYTIIKVLNEPTIQILSG